MCDETDSLILEFHNEIMEQISAKIYCDYKVIGIEPNLDKNQLLYVLELTKEGSKIVIIKTYLVEFEDVDN